MCNVCFQELATKDQSIFRNFEYKSGLKLFIQIDVICYRNRDIRVENNSTLKRLRAVYRYLLWYE